MVKVAINQVTHQITKTSELMVLIDAIKTIPDLEIWVQHENGSSICTLLNEHCGWMMFLRYPEDTGFSTRNLQMIENEDFTEYRLSNGQVDEYPKHWAYPREAVFDALVKYVEDGKPSKMFHWNDDS